MKRQNKKASFVIAAASAATLSALAPAVSSGQIMINTAGSPVTENFDGILTTVPANNTVQSTPGLPSGWSWVENPVNTQYRVHNGSGNAGDFYLLGDTASSERALGGIASGGVQATWGGQITNNTGSVLTRLDISYIGETWRDGGNAGATNQTTNFQYSTDATSLTTGTWTDLDALDLISTGIGTTATATLGNTPGFQTNPSSSITSLIANGASVWIRWRDTNDTGNDHALAVDNFSVTGIAPDVLVYNGGGVWDFTTSNWLPGPQTITNLDIASFNSSFSGNVAVDGGGVAPIATLVNASTNYTFSGGSINGSGPLVKSGSGTLVLSNTNGYSGGTQINGGTLSVADDAALGAGTSPLSFNGGTLLATGNLVSVLRAVTFTGATNTIDTGAFDVNVNGASGGGGLTKQGSGALTFSGNVGASGASIALTISAGNVVLNSIGTSHLSAPNATSINGQLVLAGGAKRVNFNSGTFGGSGSIEIASTGHAISVDGNLTSFGGTISVPINLGTGNTTRFGVAGATNTLTIGGVVSGASDVVFDSDTDATPGGTGVVLLNSAGGWSGSTSINTGNGGGVVRLGASGSLPSGTALVFGLPSGTVAVGTLDLNGKSQTVASLASETTGAIGGIVNTNASQATLTINGSADTSYSGSIGIPANTTNLTGANDNIAVVRSGSGITTLRGASTYTGGTTVSGGTLRVSNTTGSGTGTGTVSVASGGTLGGTGKIGGAVSVATGGAIAPGASVGTLQMASLTLDNASTLSIELGGGSADGIALTGAANNLTLTSGTVSVNLSDIGGVTPGVYTLIDYAGTVQGSGALGAPSSLAGFSASIENNAANTSRDLRVLFDTTVNPLKTFSAGSGNWNTASNNWNGNAAAFATGDQALFDNTNTGAGPFTITVDAGGVSPAWTFFNNTSKAFTVTGGSINGTGGLTKTGAGTLTINNTNAFSGAVTVRDGVLSVNSWADSGTNSALGSGSTITIGAGGTLSYTGVGNALTNRPVTLDLGGSTIEVSTGGVIVDSSGQYSGLGSLTKAGPGELRLSNTGNNYAGATTVSAGTLRNTASEVIPDTSAVTVAGSATYNLDANSETVGSIAGAGTITGTGTLTAGGDNSSTTFSGPINGAGFHLTKAGTGTLALTGSNGMTGSLKLSAGTVAIGSNTPIANVTDIMFLNPSTLRATGTFSTDRNINLQSFGGTISVDSGQTMTVNSVIAEQGGTGARLTKAGPGTLTLTKPSASRNDPTTIDGGTLRLAVAPIDLDANKIGPLGTGAVTINNGGTLEIADMEIGQSAPTDTRPQITLFGGATLKGTGSTDRGGNSIGAVVQGNTLGVRIDSGTEVTLATGAASDSFVINSTVRNTLAGPSAAKIIVNGPGRVHLASGAVSPTGDTFSGTWEVTGGGILQIGPIVSGGLGTPLNGLGFDTSNPNAQLGPTRPVTLKSGSTLVLAQLGGNGISVDTFRSPITLDGGGIASRDYLGVDGSFSGDITINSTSFINTNDPVTIANTGARTVNISTQSTPGGAPVTNGNIDWNSGSATLNVNGAGTVRFDRVVGTGPTSTVEVAAGAAMQINNSATVILAGTQNALSDGTNHVNVTNNSSASFGLDIESGTKGVGNVDGTGNTRVGAGTTLNASRVRQNSLVVNGNANIRSNGTVSGTSIVKTLTVNSGAVLDTQNNDLLIDYTGGSPEGAIRTLVLNGLNVTGTGELRTTATVGAFATTLAVADNADIGFSDWEGIPIDADTVIGKFTFFGDGNLDGSVDNNDYFVVDGGLGDTSGKWILGDLNLDGITNADDYFVIDGQLGATGLTLPAGGGAGVTAVPEPSTLGLLMMTAATALRRRRRQSN